MSIKSHNKKLYRTGICKYEDKADLCNIPWLKKEYTKFERDVEQVREQWERLKDDHKELMDCDTPSDAYIDKYLQQKINKFLQKMERAYQIQLIRPLIPEGSVKQGMVNLDLVDFRPWKVIYDDDNPKHKNNNRLRNQVKKFQSTLWKVDVAPLLNKKHGVLPKVTEISFLAYGTQLQPIHCDYVWEEGGETHTSTPVQQGTGFFGQFLYNWSTNNRETQAHIVVEPLQLEDAPDSVKQSLKRNIGGQQVYKSRTISNYYIPPGHCCLFAGHIKHGGGINTSPNVRLHVHLDPPEKSGIPKRIRGHLHIPPPLPRNIKDRAMQKRKRVALRKARYNPC